MVALSLNKIKYLHVAPAHNFKCASAVNKIAKHTSGQLNYLSSTKKKTNKNLKYYC